MSSPAAQIHVLNGPNLNLLGTREPDVYGADTLDDIAARLAALGEQLGLAVTCRQSNHEGDLVDWLHQAQAEGARAVLLNAGAYTHTSVALHDAIRAIKVPVIEVHLSNVHTREPFRHHSFVSGIAQAVLCGFGSNGYRLALQHLSRQLKG